jgi:ABC-2 type transport system ATP-binding protein
MNADNQTSTAISAHGLGKRYGEQWALRDFDLEVPAGTVLGLLGHNGAGKTTAIRILTTLALPSAGSAAVAGIDVVADPARVRECIGVTGQAATVDGLLSARANLELIGRLYHLPRATAHARAAELLERLNLADVGGKLVRDFSGGMRRRLDLAASLVAAPPILFLDEPTTGLDPESRNELWVLLGELVREGTTLLLTTQYLEEADRAADQIILLDHGRIRASGSPTELKAAHGGERIAVTLPNLGQLEQAAEALARFADGAVDIDREQTLVTAATGPETRLIEVVRALDERGVDASDVHRREATLDDVFLSITRTPTNEEVAS